MARGILGDAEIRPLGLRYLFDEGATGRQDRVARDLLWASPTSAGPDGEVVHGDAVEFSPPSRRLGPTPGDQVFAK